MINNYNNNDTNDSGKGNPVEGGGGVAVHICANIHKNPPCLIALPPSLTRSFYDQGIDPRLVAIRLNFQPGKSISGKSKGSNIIIGWNGLMPEMNPSIPKKGTNNPDQIIEVDSTFAKCLGLPDTALLSFIPYSSIRPAKSILVEPVSESDWEILACRAELVEGQFLNQIQFVSQGQIIPIRITSTGSSFSSASTTVYMKIIECTYHDHNDADLQSSAQSARLEVDSRVIITPKPRQSNQQHRDFIKRRCLPFELLDRESISSPGCMTNNSFFVALHPSDRNLFGMLGADMVVSISLLPNPASHSSEKMDSNDLKQRKQGIFVSVLFHSNVPLGHVIMPDWVRRNLGADALPFCQVAVSSALGLSTVQDVPITLHPSPGLTNSSAQDFFKTWLSITVKQFEGNVSVSSKLLPLSNGLTVIDVLDPSRHISLSFASGESKLYISLPFDKIMLSSSNGETQALVSIGKSVNMLQMLAYPIRLPVQSIFDSALNAASEFVHVRIQNWASSCQIKNIPGAPNSCFLVVGREGSGKTTFLETIQWHLMKLCPYFFAPLNFAALESLALSPSRICENMMAKIKLGLWSRPCCLIIDDLDQLLPVPTAADEQAANDANSSPSRTDILVEIFIKLFTQFNGGPIFASCQNLASLHPRIRHFFPTWVDISSPNLNERQAILSSNCNELWSFHSRQLEPILHQVSAKTAGMNAVELREICERALPLSLSSLISSNDRSSDSSPAPSLAHFEKAIQDHAAAKDSRNGAGARTTPNPINWDLIGGLHQAKQTILETIEWPSKYAALFDHAPIRLGSGLLIFGYPGCGKTLLASSIAEHANLSLITVHGPALLSKYIGASEAGIRDTFSRATAQAPCVLFFDDFDALAPRRGSGADGGSAGVTDRLVNQLLTMLDGAEGLGKGVFVVAATSRPDMIDPALLRPGRLDKSVFCNLPTLEERLDILQCVVQAYKYNMHQDVNLTWIARQTEGFSGADLAGLLNDASVNAIQEHVQERMLETSSISGLSSLTLRTHSLPDRKGKGKALPASSIPIARKSLQVEEADPTLTLRAFQNGEEISLSSNETHLILKHYKLRHNAAKSNNANALSIHEADTAIILHNRHIKSSLSTSRPSIGPADKSKLDHRFREFLQPAASPRNSRIQGTRACFA